LLHTYRRIAQSIYMYISNFLIILLPLASIASPASDIRAVQKVVEKFLASTEGIQKVREMLVISLKIQYQG